IPTPPILCPRFVGSLTVATQDSRPSGSLLLSRETLSFSASCRFIPAHCYGDFSPTTRSEAMASVSEVECDHHLLREQSHDKEQCRSIAYLTRWTCPAWLGTRSSSI